MRLNWSVGHSRKGSALLVVLGMLAFMIISAVAFSAWMRAGRLPNSFLRRTAASRQLVKAALAAAIDEVDVAIGNNPHPGLGSRNYSFREDGRVRGTGTSANRNLWLGRVYIGKSDDSSSNSARDHLLEATKTVSTLTLEGLAYIPPPFVSEARYYSRRSNAATWHDLDFDSGRYAFTAIDVSDCFDINRVSANVGRGTSPYGRISLAYAFENNDHNGYRVKPSVWDTFIKQYFVKKTLATAEVDSGSASGSDIVDSSHVPATSVADLNLAMYAAGSGCGFESPFSKYVSGASSSFYGGISPESDEGRRIASMAFVADGWYPFSAKASTQAGGSIVTPLDLADEANQPFPRADLNDNRNLMAVAEQASSTCAVRLRDKISRMGLVLLRDYLDPDDVPMSLAIPQVERTPMVAAVKHNFDASSVAVTVKTEPETDEKSNDYPNIVSGGGKDDTSRVIRRVKTYRLDPTKFAQGIDGGFQALLVYPFRRGTDISDPDSFTADAHVDFFFTADNMQLRTGNRSDLFHEGEWGTEADFAKTKFRNGIFRIGYTSQVCTFNNVKDEQSAMKLVSFVSSSAGSEVAKTLNSNDGLLFEVTWEVAQTRNIDKESGLVSAWQNQGEWKRVSAVSGLSPISATGVVDERFRDSKALVGYLNGDHVDVTVCAAITVRIKNGDGKTVDLAPAGLLDDKNLNNVNNLAAMEEMGNVICGRPGPLLLFKGGAFKMGDTEFDSNAGEAQFNLMPKAAMCSDPRWNWAPEHWFEASAIEPNTWLANCQVATTKRDRDIFMMTSDIGHLQSVYELACLPRLTPLDSYGNDALRGNMESLADASFERIPTQFADTRNQNLMWKTYNPYYRKEVDGFDVSGDARRDPFDDLNIVNSGGGFKINPFSDSTNVVLAAFANTPTDWWCAGLDSMKQAGIGETERKDASTFNMKYAFSKFNDNARFAWDDVKRIAGNFIAVMHSSDVANDSLNDGLDAVWQTAFDQDLNWSGNVGPNQGDWHNLFGTRVDGVSSGNSDLDALTDDLYDVDRKFLYGYWRECFSVRQQLFLIFVRAEPMMMGGGAVGAVPPQLGARAVALVWRDPAPAPGYENDIRYPHRTRVLFYRQLD